jgi:trans-aconitate methyltransferase
VGVTEWKLYDGEPPEWTTPGWYAGREHAPHLEQRGHQQRLYLAADYADMAIDSGARTVCDLGAGDGGLLSLIAARNPGVEAWGYDLQQTNIDAAKGRGATVYLEDITDGTPPPADLYVATEILEHLADPRALLDELVGEWLVASSPYTESDEDHYAFHTWAWDEPGYQAMLADCGWETLTNGKAWICQVVLAHRP